MNTATVNGIEIAYHDEGSGLPLLLVHAFPLSSAMWVRQIAGFGPRCRVIAPDLRGFGDTARGSAADSLDQYGRRPGRPAHYLKIERATVAGLSMGGYVTFALWRRHRDRVAGLILADTRADADTEEGRQTREQNARAPSSRRARPRCRRAAAQAAGALRHDACARRGPRADCDQRPGRTRPRRCARWPRAPTRRRCCRRLTCPR